MQFSSSDFDSSPEFSYAVTAMGIVGLATYAASCRAKGLCLAKVKLISKINRSFVKPEHTFFQTSLSTASSADTALI